MPRALTRTDFDASLPLADGQHEAYAIARSIGYGKRESCRRAKGKPENGSATKWEGHPHVIARIKYLTRFDPDVIIEKRRRLEDRLNLAAYFNILDYAKLDDDGRIIAGSVDWQKLAKSEFGAVISEFRFDNATGMLTNFKRDDALAALAQLRDMHGFKAPARTELSGPGGEPLTLDALIAASMKPKTEAA